jgi:thiol-disulfide isomerase/thioredoxin
MQDFTRNKSLLLGLVATAILVLPCPESRAQVVLAPGDTVPALNGITFPKGTQYNADWSGQELTLVNFWATWCVPCEKEMPELQKLFEKHVVQGFRIVGVFERNELEHVAGFLARVPVTYTIIRPSALVEYYWAGVKIKPTSFLIDKNGRVLRRYVGASPEQIAGLVADVEAVLDGRTMATQVMPPAPALPEAYKERLGGGSGR